MKLYKRGRTRPKEFDENLKTFELDNEEVAEKRQQSQIASAVMSVNKQINNYFNFSSISSAFKEEFKEDVNTSTINANVMLESIHDQNRANHVMLAKEQINFNSVKQKSRTQAFRQNEANMFSFGETETKDKKEDKNE